MVNRQQRLRVTLGKHRLSVLLRRLLPLVSVEDRGRGRRQIWVPVGINHAEEDRGPQSCLRMTPPLALHMLQDPKMQNSMSS